jgi:Tol biopolymer transport system component
MDSQGKNKRQLTHNQAINTQPRWSFDGKEIVYVSAASGNLAIWTMDRDGKNPRQLTFDTPARDPYLIKENN